MKNRIVIREMTEEDCETISLAFAAQGWNKPLTQYLDYFQESKGGRRTVLVAEYGGQFAGYVTIAWESHYPPFHETRIPEIADFNVLLRYQRHGIGSALMDEAEKRVSIKSAVVGIGVGLTADYGAAQALYVKRGYVPDGRGISQHGEHLQHGEMVIVDDHLTLYFTKRLEEQYDRESFPMDITESDILFFRRAIELANEAEKRNNLPIGAVIGFGGRIIAEGKNAIWFPTFNPNRHAEVEALRQVPEHLWQYSQEMTLYTTLEPCLMCTGAILLHHVGRVLYGSADHYGGASRVFGHMPTYFEEEVSKIEWLGPAYPEGCDELFKRVMALVERRRAIELGYEREVT